MCKIALLELISLYIARKFMFHFNDDTNLLKTHLNNNNNNKKPPENCIGDSKIGFSFYQLDCGVLAFYVLFLLHKIDICIYAINHKAQGPRAAFFIHTHQKNAAILPQQILSVAPYMKNFSLVFCSFFKKSMLL